MPTVTIQLPDLALLHECFEYRPETGDLVWKARPQHHFRSEPASRTFNTRYAGRAVRAKDSCGYYMVDVNRRSYKAHRLIYTMMIGPIPDGLQVDHINGDRADNRLENLRLVTSAVNARNRRMRKDNRSGVTGVCWDADSRKYVAYATENGQQRRIGRYRTVRAAAQARERLRPRLEAIGFTDRHGLRAEHDTRAPSGALSASGIQQ